MKKRVSAVREEKSWGAVKSLAAGVIFSYILSIIAIFIFAWVLYSTGVSEESAATVILVITLLSTFLGGFLCARLKKSGGLLFGAAVGLIYFIILYIISVASGVRSLGIPALSTAVFACLTAALGGVIGVNIGRKK